MFVKLIMRQCPTTNPSRYVSGSLILLNWICLCLLSSWSTASTSSYSRMLTCNCPLLLRFKKLQIRDLVDEQWHALSNWMNGRVIVKNSYTLTTLVTCNCSVCFFQFKLWWLCWPCIQIGKYFQSLSTSFSFPWKWRHMASIFRSAFYVWSFETATDIRQADHYSNT